MILEEEYKEALGCRLVLSLVLGGSSGATVTLLDAAIETGNGVVWPAATAVVAVLSVLGISWCHRTIRGWRDQKRFELAQREVEKMGAMR